jgi:2,4-dienoyl-CoA reductase-like NADH-dependent reductase (Old Yellow Enzyme family)/thioredoxin reductase
MAASPQTDYPHLFSPLNIGGLRLPNRICHVATDISSANADGSVNQRVITYYEQVAKGGCGFIIIGASTPDRATGRPTVTCLALDEDPMIPGLAELAEAIHRQGAACAIQIQHPGRQAAWPRKDQISATDQVVQLPGSAGHEVVYAEEGAKGKSSRAMSVDEIYQLAEKFAEAAWRVQQAGFDAVQLHGAHGYLIAQFMSPYINKRNDRFGGSFINRMRFVLEIMDRIQRKCGRDFPVGVRYSGVEWVEGGRTIEESARIAQLLEQHGAAFVDISAGTFEAPAAVMDPSYYPQGWNTYAAEEVKKHVKIPVITSHTLRDPDYCETILAEGKADIVGLSRQMISDPDWANKARAGKPEEIRKCISCLVGCWQESLMIKRHMRCAINPAIGDERFINLRRTAVAKTVAIVGGGPSGMEAARIAALRGHQVTIFEKASELGGMLLTCCMVPGKQKMKWFLDWERAQLATLGVDVRLNHTAAMDDLSGYDFILCGTGAAPAKAEIPGADRLLPFHEVLSCTRSNCEFFPAGRSCERAEVGQRVVIWGDHFAALDTAEALGARGREVTIVTENKQVGAAMEVIHREVLLKRLAGSNGEGLKGHPVKIPVKILTQSTILEIGDGEVTVIDAAFHKQRVAADTVIQAHVVPDDSLFQQLRQSGLPVALMGDARGVNNLRGAVISGANLGLTIGEDAFLNANGALTREIPSSLEMAAALERRHDFEVSISR